MNGPRDEYKEKPRSGHCGRTAAKPFQITMTSNGSADINHKVAGGYEYNPTPSDGKDSIEIGEMELLC
ncbi:hypothetical protein WA026_015545 [Henosepilachna vigintioctopunctata]|uniref:Uncharacterized protein n=1 Tax=Henosepilachna vigintioctopunctata TaxID=420089 RepID=A0AAW1VD17_9CUCU